MTDDLVTDAGARAGPPSRSDADRRVQQQVTERFFAEQVLAVRNPDKLAGLSVTGSGTDLGSGG